MKVLLVKPISDKLPIIVPNLGLGYLATALRKNNHDVKILDCVKDRLNYAGFGKEIASFNPDVVGFQMFTCDYGSVKHMLSQVKQYNPKIMTLIGGPHVSGDPYHVLTELTDADFGFIGEAEVGICELLAKKIPSQVSSLIYRENHGITVNPTLRVDNLDELGFPAWDLMDPSSYPIAPHGTFVRKIPVAPIITTRGCPYLCTYCAGHINTGRKFRKRSLDNVMAEIDMLYNQYSVREFHIEDDNFTLDKNYALEFCNRLMSRKYDVTWACPNGVRLDTLDKELLQAMEKAGCYSFAIGIESGSPRILRLMNRSVTVEKMIEKVTLIKDCTHIHISGFCMMGFPGETMEDMQMTSDLAYRLPLDKVQFGNFLPLPGTELYAQLLSSGEITKETLDWEKYLTTNVVYSPKGISVDELKSITRKARWRFYARPKIIWGLLSEIRSFEHVKIIMERALDNFV
jgi:anaerobic magnesium-protoporphyrin IX monomethyl ester cyclase